MVTILRKEKLMELLLMWGVKTAKGFTQFNADRFEISKLALENNMLVNFFDTSVFIPHLCSYWHRWK